ncbi:MAG: hypothetical protein JNK65_03285, partial [Deltaproteobacteria bacterium]|nr:hypothetical protein [Deltaproteobacteria bacterium]
MYYPILSLLLGFIFGILSIRFSIPNTVEWMSFLFFLILTILQFLKPLRLFTYLAMFILFFGLGHFSVRSELNRIDRNSSLIHHLSAEKVYWVAEVEEDCVPQEQGWHLKLQMQSIQNEKGAFEA